MRLGVCTSVENAQLVADAGFDYMELSVFGDLAPDDDDWAERRRAIEKMPLPVEAFNSFVRTGKIIGPEADPVRLRRYVNTALARAAEVGGKIIVFGSGPARNIPDGFPQSEVNRQLNDFLGYCADASDSTGVTVVIEPLSPKESNIINLVSEGAAIARQIGRSGVQNLADTYHMAESDEPLSAIVASADVLAHVHTADTARVAPSFGSFDFALLFDTLREAGYDARVSVECNFKDFAAEVGPSGKILRDAYARSQARA